MTLLSAPSTPFWATVKSAFPVSSTAAAELRRLWVTTESVTTVSTPIATASAVRAVRSFLVHRLCTIKPKNVMTSVPTT
jgi:predicted deacylase